MQITFRADPISYEGLEQKFITLLQQEQVFGIPRNLQYFELYQQGDTSFGLPYIGIDFCKDELIEIFNNFAMRLVDTRFLPNFLLVITKVQLFKGNIDSDTFRYIHIKYIRDCELSLVISDDDFEDKGHEIVTEFLNELNIN